MINGDIIMVGNCRYMYCVWNMVTENGFLVGLILQCVCLFNV